MEYRSLGRTGVQVSMFCLGCGNYGDRTSEQDAFEIIDHAIEAGINFFDTANVYGRGKNEEFVGKALSRNGKRSRIVLATKVFGRMDDDPNSARSHRRHIIEQCNASLQRLRTDFIDLYQIHQPTSEIPIDETLRALDDLIRSGKVRYIGTSNYAAWQIMESLWVSKEYGLNRFISEQSPYHLLDRRIERELIPMSQTYGIAIITWSPLAGGFLTGKYKQNQMRPAGSRYAAESLANWAQQHFIDRAFTTVEFCEQLAKEKNCTLGQLALAWNAGQPGITSAIIGPRTLEQLNENLKASEVSISLEERQKIDLAIPPKQAIVPYFEGDYGPHQYRW
jgi:aryl-alcohol dehydrogenase-like predicted oxidoreductase